VGVILEGFKRFREWLKEIEEVSTSTADVAYFARPIFSTTDLNMYPEPIVMQDEEKKKSKWKIRQEGR
jgi:hypothetical protein